MKIVCLGMLLVWLFTLVLWFFASQRNALIEARDQAAVRLLSELHCELVGRGNISQETYLKELHDFEKGHEGYRLLTMYVRDVEERQKELDRQRAAVPARQ
jgi:hypothetical protein